MMASLLDPSHSSGNANAKFEFALDQSNIASFALNQVDAPFSLDNWRDRISFLFISFIIVVFFGLISSSSAFFISYRICCCVISVLLRDSEYGIDRLNDRSSFLNGL